MNRAQSNNSNVLGHNPNNPMDTDPKSDDITKIPAMQSKDNWNDWALQEKMTLPAEVRIGLELKL